MNEIENLSDVVHDQDLIIDQDWMEQFEAIAMRQEQLVAKPGKIRET